MPTVPTRTLLGRDEGIAPIDGEIYGQIAPKDRLHVAVFGDSIMWGQGLAQAEKFKSLIRAALGAEYGLAGVIDHDRSRSGAKIADSGLDREEFLDTFPRFFTNRPQRARFRAGTDEGRANSLYGEAPATFPIVRWQVDALDATVGETINVVLLSGGVNDIGFEDILDPQEFPGAFIEEFDGKIETASYASFLDLIRRARTKCPNAIIMAFGYYSPLSYSSDYDDIKKFFKFEFDNDVKWFLNEVVDYKDVDRMIVEARIRSMWAQGRGQYWMRRAIAEANRDEVVRGPGLLFVPSGFTPDNAMFAGTPFIFEDYDAPTSDPAQKDRVANCPRIGFLKDIRAVLFDIGRWRIEVGEERIGERIGGAQAATPTLDLAASKRLRDALVKASEGPESLVEALSKFVAAREARAGQPSPTTLTERIKESAEVRDVEERLIAELHRIQRTMIASFVHPNPAGARRYADNALERYRRHRQITADIARDSRPGQAAAAAAGPESLDAMLTRYGLRSSGSLQADSGHLDVDSLALTIVTARDSDATLTPNVCLVVTTRTGRSTYQLNFPYRFGRGGTVGGPPSTTIKKFYPDFEPGKTTRCTIDTAGGLRLDDITGFSIAVGADPVAGKRTIPTSHGTTWRPRRLTLEINGQQVLDRTFRSTEVAAGDDLDLSYPPKAPKAQAPVAAQSAG